jgi:flagellar protein FlaJ
MAAISSSMVEPTKIFRIISATKEYPNLEREFNKLLNEINVYGYDFVTALKDVASNSPSQKLAELFNGLATTITSGGDLFDFFDKRSQTLLFEYRLDREKQTKSAETFMDIYISVVIAAPMIFMLIFMMMKISGFGVSLSTTMITLLVVGGVSLINVFFLIFLQVKHQGT